MSPQGIDTTTHPDYDSSSTEAERLTNADHSDNPAPPDPKTVHNLHTAEQNAGMMPTLGVNANEDAHFRATGVKPELPHPEKDADMSLLDKRRRIAGEASFADLEQEYPKYEPEPTKSNVPVNQLSSPGDSTRLYDEMGIHHGDRVINVNANDGTSFYPPEESRRRYAMKVGPSYYNVGGLLAQRNSFGVGHPGRWVGIQSGQPTFVPYLDHKVAQERRDEEQKTDKSDPSLKPAVMNNNTNVQDNAAARDASPNLVGQAANANAPASEKFATGTHEATAEAEAK